MSESPFAATPGSVHHKHCFECSALLNLGDKSCWMRHAEQPLMGKRVASSTSYRSPAANPWTTKAAVWLGIIAAVVVTYGVLRSGAYLLATLFLIAALPTLVIVMVGSAISRAAGKPWGAGTIMGVAAGSVVTTVIVFIVAAAVAVLVIFAMFVAMIQDCFRALGGH